MKPVNIIGIYLLLAICLLVALPIWIYTCNPFEKQLLNILVYIACSGGIGGTIYCIRGFYQNLGNNNFKMNWTWWYVFRPIISAIIGVFAYFMIIGGLMSISNSPDVNYSKSVMFYCAISFLAGFSFNKFVEKIDVISDTLFSKKDTD
ncbi:hypothetical protein [Ulvibacterium marinum]|uniref:Uncharacterized protein n=1 Tax=Ulvibacterium marinum TaxID=2419782 RepID=A0A3B0C2T1_9FLAO|nr:hypothetical protein [Ulvibacterium marinum]RKN79782.1 hypothetical protein D7Z94_16000 [Ulvibacterium marinum]